MREYQKMGWEIWECEKVSLLECKKNVLSECKKNVLSERKRMCSQSVKECAKFWDLVPIYKDWNA